MITRCLSVLVLLGLGGSAATGDEPLTQRLQRTISASESEERELSSLSIDELTYAGAQLGLGDLRIIDEQGATVPFLIHSSSRTRRQPESRWSIEPISVEMTDEGLVRIEIHLEPEMREATVLRLVTPMQDFENRVDVAELDPSGATIGELVSGGLIFDYSSVIDARSDQLELPPHDAARLRIELRAKTDDLESPFVQLTRSLDDREAIREQEQLMVSRRPFRIDRIELIRPATEVAADENQMSHWETRPVRMETSAGETTFELEIDNRPVSRLSLNVTDENFSRRVLIEATNDATVTALWRDVREGVVHRFKYRQIDDRRLSIEIPETRAARLRLRVVNRDSPSLDVTSVDLAGPIEEVVFFQEPGHAYSLVYGAVVEPPDYDLAAIERALDEGERPTPRMLGAEQARLDAASPEPVNWWNDPTILGAVVLVLVLVLALSLFWATRRVGPIDVD